MIKDAESKDNEAGKGSDSAPMEGVENDDSGQASQASQPKNGDGVKNGHKPSTPAKGKKNVQKRTPAEEKQFQEIVKASGIKGLQKIDSKQRRIYSSRMAIVNSMKAQHGITITDDELEAVYTEHLDELCPGQTPGSVADRECLSGWQMDKLVKCWAADYDLKFQTVCVYRFSDGLMRMTVNESGEQCILPDVKFCFVMQIETWHNRVREKCWRGMEEKSESTDDNKVCSSLH